jgi:tetratricopeptide (TPR) repeat protein
LQFWKRAVAYLQKQKYREALADLNQVISLNPQSVPALLRRAKIYRDMGKFSEAKKDITEILKLRPADKEASQLKEGIDQADEHLESGRKMFSAQRWRDAVHSFTKAIELAPVVEEGRLMRARASLKLREYNVVVDDTSALLKVRKNNLDAIYVRAKAFMYLGETDAALKYG